MATRRDGIQQHHCNEIKTDMRRIVTNLEHCEIAASIMVFVASGGKGKQSDRIGIEV